LMAVVWLVVRGDVVGVRGAVRAFAGFATVGHAHIRGLGTPRPLFVARPPSKVERARPGAGAQATTRAASPAATGCGECQREFVSLLRVVGVGAASGPVVGQVAISQQ
jgi:hypothetical protein